MREADAPNAIEEQVAAARLGRQLRLICRMASGWLLIGERQVLPGYCVLLADPVVASLNALTDAARSRYCLDMIAVGDALLAVTGAYRINYETWCNQAPALHTHVTPRYADEPDEKRVVTPECAYGGEAGRAFDPRSDLAFMEQMRTYLGSPRDEEPSHA